jgi:transcriptional regulator with XRE-family HTH domain
MHVVCHVLIVGRPSRPDPALAAALRQLREDRYLTREALAFQAGITSGSLARIELGTAAPGWDTVRRLARALGVSLNEIASAVEALDA